MKQNLELRFSPQLQRVKTLFVRRYGGPNFWDDQKGCCRNGSFYAGFAREEPERS